VLVARDQIPLITAQLVVDAVDKPRRSVQANRFVPPDQQPKQAVESEEMIDVGMGDEHLAGAEDLACRQSGDVADVEQERGVAEQGLDIDCRVARPSVDKVGMKKRTHRIDFLKPPQLAPERRRAKCKASSASVVARSPRR
jgi:hypothetical protein